MNIKVTKWIYLKSILQLDQKLLLWNSKYNFYPFDPKFYLFSTYAFFESFMSSCMKRLFCDLVGSRTRKESIVPHESEHKAQRK